MGPDDPLCLPRAKGPRAAWGPLARGACAHLTGRLSGKLRLGWRCGPGRVRQQGEGLTAVCLSRMCSNGMQ